MKVKLLRIGFAINNNNDPGRARKPCYKIHSHFFSSIMWWGMMFFMFVIIFPANKDRFMKVIASVVMASGIVLMLVNTKFSIGTLFGSSWGYALLTGATISVFVYMHILMQNRRSRTTPTTAAVSSSSSLLTPSTSISSRKNSKNTINNKNSMNPYIMRARRSMNQI
ncbi:MAG: hypothetical protein ACJ712_04820 [Nitrososphaeraceae archaeon]